jgi:hypothetical protein
VMLMWDDLADEQRVSAQRMEHRLTAAAPGWVVEYRCQGILVLVADASNALGAHRLFGHAGVVIGETFVRQSEFLNEALCPHAVFGERETGEVVRSIGGTTLRSW